MIYVSCYLRNDDQIKSFLNKFFFLVLCILFTPHKYGNVVCKKLVNGPLTVINATDYLNGKKSTPTWSSGSVLDHRSLPPVFESRRGHI